MRHETPAARIIERIGKPNAVELFGRRVHRTTVANWIAGRRAMPQWAIDRLAQEWQAIETATRADLDRLKPGPGLRAGAINLARYLASKHRA